MSRDADRSDRGDARCGHAPMGGRRRARPGASAAVAVAASRLARVFAVAAMGLAVQVAHPGAVTTAWAAGAPVAPMHGGVLSKTKQHTFETVMSADGIRIYLYTAEGAPAMVEDAKGTARFKLTGGRTVEAKLAAERPAEGEAIIYFCPMHPEVVQNSPGKCEPCHGMILYKQDRLFGKADLSGVAPENVSAMVRLTGLAGKEKEATFSPAFRKPERKAASSQSGASR